MVGLTSEAESALNGNPLEIEALPFRIGRESSSSDVLSYNDLSIQDQIPYHN